MKEIRIENVIWEEALKKIKRIYPDAKFIQRAERREFSKTGFCGATIKFGSWLSNLKERGGYVTLHIERNFHFSEIRTLSWEVKLPTFEDPKFLPKEIIGTLLPLARREKELRDLIKIQNEESEEEIRKKFDQVQNKDFYPD